MNAKLIESITIERYYRWPTFGEHCFESKNNKDNHNEIIIHNGNTVRSELYGDCRITIEIFKPLTIISGLVTLGPGRGSIIRNELRMRTGLLLKQIQLQIARMQHKRYFRDHIWEQLIAAALHPSRAYAKWEAEQMFKS